MSDPRASVLDWDGPLSPPRRNGELVFETVWESRVFGMTMAMYEAGAFRWEEFRDQLIAAIGEWDRAHDIDDAGYRYWERWLTAFERLVAVKGLCSPQLLETRLVELGARPHGHDHPASERRGD